jgi:MarR family transcriptional regulator, lower aerobic nicotinate degradation pathway regulator
MPGPPRASTRTAAEALVTVAPLASRWIERLLAAHDPPLTVAQFLALRAIDEEGASGSDLARRAGVSGPAVSQLVAGLADAGLLVRKEFAQDRRRQTLSVSARGRTALRSAEDLLTERLSSLLAEVPRPEADALSRALPGLAAVLSGAPPPRRPPPPPPPPRAHRAGSRPRPRKP